MVTSERITKISQGILILICFALVFALFSNKIWDPDFWWHLKTGEYLWQTKSLMENDPFTYTSPVKDPINPESKRIKFILNQYWLSQLIFYGVYKAAGFEGIINMRAGILTLLMFLIYRGIRREGGNLYLSLVFLASLMGVFTNFDGERPQLFSFLFAFLIFYLIEGYRKSTSPPSSSRAEESFHHLGSLSRFPSLRTVAGSHPVIFYLLPIPFIMVLWANLHGGFIVGLIMLAVYIVAESIKYKIKKIGNPLPHHLLKPLIFIGVISMLCSLLNPNGYNVFPLLIELQKSLYMHVITETKPALTMLKFGFYNVELISFFIMLIVLSFIFLLNLKRLDLTDLLLSVFLAGMTLSAVRGIPFFTPFAVVMIVRYGKLLITTMSQNNRVLAVKKLTSRAITILTYPFIKIGIPIALSIILIFILIKGEFRKGGTVRTDRYPVGAAKFLKENKLSGNMFNPYVWGGYLIWALYPDYKVFIDGRGLIEAVVFQCLKITDASPLQFSGIPEWKAMLDAYKVTYIVTFSVWDHSGDLVQLVPALLDETEWHLIYMDNNSLIFAKDTPENAEIIRRYSLPKEWLWNEVIVEATQKSKEFKGESSFFVTIGDAFVQKKNYWEARNAYLKAAQMNPGNPIIGQKLKKLEGLVPL